MASLKNLTSLALSSYLFYGAFSRLTHGVYTPQHYAYQIDRSPDDGSTLSMIIPCMDIMFASLILVPRTRSVAAGLVTMIMALGMIARRFEGKDAVMDGIITFGTFVCWMVLDKVDW